MFVQELMATKDKADQELNVLAKGDIDIEGLIPDSSNGALKVKIEYQGLEVEAIVKPEVSIRPLWDFPQRDLNDREYAAYLFDQELEMNLIPPTVMREVDGIGKLLVQKWILETENNVVIVRSPEDIPDGYLKVLQGYDELNKLITLAHIDSREIRSLCLFDLIINNADRKGGHLLKDSDNKTWAIDHGISWHVDEKIRTVLWGWVGKEFDDTDRDFLNKSMLVLERWQKDQFSHLPKIAIKKALERVDGLLELNSFPQPGQQHPAVPWPIF